MTDPRRSEILSAIGDELAKSSHHLDYTVDHWRRDGDAWIVTVDLTTDKAKGLDESYEGSMAWWPAAPKNGAADVLSIIPENQQINLRFATCPPPSKGGLLRLYPARYLEALGGIWGSVCNAECSLNWIDRIRDRNEYCAARVPSPGAFGEFLRKNQCEAFDLMGWNAGFLWGPPGTGKTFTLGAMLARHLLAFPQSKLLLLSTTNTATDQALVAVDKALERMDPTHALKSLLGQSVCKRVGQHFLASNYHGRSHLLPVQDFTLLKELTQLETARPDKSDVRAYAAWKSREEAVREEIRKQAGQVLDCVTLAAMTTTRAAFTFDHLVARAPFGMIVFDEASQVSLAHALALAPLSDKVLFAGDPKQLAPIVQTKHHYAQKWLGNSMFAEMNTSGSATRFLSEQSRMAEPICRVVSQVFYNGELTVAQDAKADLAWDKFRNVSPDRAIEIVSVDTNGTWSQKYRGPIRYESAEKVRDAVLRITQRTDETSVLVLTPFRAQRTLVRTFLERAGFKRVRVSTVHKAQGSERHTVLFDPVDGENSFLQTEDARRLVNVALSRAPAKLVLFLSRGDRKNVTLDQIATVIERQDNPLSGTPVAQLIAEGGFPTSAVGCIAEINGKSGKILEALNQGKKFRFQDFASGETRTFLTAVVVQSVATKNQDG